MKKSRLFFRAALACLCMMVICGAASVYAATAFYHILAKNTPASSSGRDEFALNGCSHSKIHARSIFQ